jgi:sigma-B regulation protein RsbU (phosphoserine phosphatase)
VDEIIAPAVATRGKIITATHAAREHINDETNMVRDIFTVSFFILLAVVVVLAVLFARVITKPVESLKAATTALGEGNLDYHVAIRTGDEFEELGESFNRMAADLRKNLEDLRRTTAEKERYTKELEIAKSIQKSFLPDTVPSIPGFEIAAFTLPAMEIGGDFYDFIQVSDDRWGLVIADVSGKGVSAAIFMALSRTLMHASGGTHPDPKAAVRRANRLIHAEAKSSMFVTLFYGVLDARKMTLSYVNAGHNPPLLVRGEPASVLSLEGKGAPMALGVRPDVYMEEDILGLQRGDLVVMYTDGVTEALNEKDEIFGEERLTGFVRANRSRPAQENITALVQEIKRFIGDAPQSDDITLLVLQVK